MTLNRRSASALRSILFASPLVLLGCSDDASRVDGSEQRTSSRIEAESSSQSDDAGASGADADRADANRADAPDDGAAPAQNWSVVELDDEAFAADPLDGIVISREFDASLDAVQVELLAFASGAAETIPHDKPRAVAEENVALTALRLDAPSLAYDYARRVENWRRGSLVADLAMHFADRGELELAGRLADRAFRIARDTESEDPQSWRRARIASKAGYVYVLCGRGSEAANLLQGIQSPDLGIVDNARVKTMSDSDFDNYLTSVELAAQAGDLELVVHTFNSCVDLIERFWSDGTRRERLEAVMRANWTKMPIPERLKLNMRLAEVATAKEDSAMALEYLDEAQEVMDAARWLPRHQLPMQAELAVMRFEAGDESGGRAELRDALASYDSEWLDMTDIWRAGALRPVAEGFHRTGRGEQAALAYARVLEDGNVNPNVKPRAEDLSATACSMALHDFRPDSAMWERMQEIRAGLVQPE